MHGIFANYKPVYIVDDLPEAGRFALDAIPPKQPSWEGCREKFSCQINQTTTGFFFSHNPCQNDNVAGFMSKSEDILNIKQKTIHSRTDKDCILWVEPSSFWMDCWVKRSFLTILLRCGMYYDPDKDNYEEALFGEGTDHADKARQYIQQTKPAVMRFMFGFTRFVQPPDVSTPTGDLHRNLWVEVFRNRPIRDLKHMLVAERPSLEFGLIGVDAIWA